MHPLPPLPASKQNPQIRTHPLTVSLTALDFTHFASDGGLVIVIAYAFRIKIPLPIQAISVL